MSLLKWLKRRHDDKQWNKIVARCPTPVDLPKWSKHPMAWHPIACLIDHAYEFYGCDRPEQT